MSESFLEVLNGDIDAVFEADNVVLPGGVLAQVRQFLKVGYDLAASLAQRLIQGTTHRISSSEASGLNLKRTI